MSDVERGAESAPLAAALFDESEWDVTTAARALGIGHPPSPPWRWRLPCCGSEVRMSKILDTLIDCLLVNLIDLGRCVRSRRTELGLSQAQLAHLSGLSRQTLVGLENGTLSDLGVNRVGQVMAVLGLQVPQPSAPPRGKGRGLWMAAKTASVSYKRELDPAALGDVLASGDVPAPFAPHLGHLLDEAPVPIVVAAVEEAASRAHVPPRQVWRNVAKLAASLAVHRRDLWA